MGKNLPTFILTIILSFLIIGVGYLFLFLTPAAEGKNKQPIENEVKVIQIEGCDHKVDNCILQNFTFHNKTFKKVNIIVSCGKQSEDAILELYPRVKQEIQFRTRQASPICFIKSWNFQK